MNRLSQEAYERQRKRSRVNPPRVVHRQRREGDECACSCGVRWPTGEDHP